LEAVAYIRRYTGAYLVYLSEKLAKSFGVGNARVTFVTT